MVSLLQSVTTVYWASDVYKDLFYKYKKKDFVLFYLFQDQNVHEAHTMKMSSRKRKEEHDLKKRRLSKIK